MAYYTSNAVYDRLARERPDGFVWAAGNAWILLYGDRRSRVKLVAFVTGSSAADVGEARDAAAMLATRAGLPFATIAFDDSVREIVGVVLNDSPASLDELTRWFARVGVPVNRGRTGKAINRASSSAYQDWQRAALGRIRVTDIDLIRQRGDGRIVVYELKRSFYSIDDWPEFPEDFPNFDLIVDFCARADLHFRILYNVVRKPAFDDPSEVAIFNYAPGTAPAHWRTMPFEDFVKG